MNLSQRTYLYGSITIINFIQLPPVSVVEEAMVSLFLLSICSYSFSNKLAYDTTHIIIILGFFCRDYIPVESLPLTTFISLLFQCEMV